MNRRAFLAAPFVALAAATTKPLPTFTLHPGDKITSPWIAISDRPGFKRVCRVEAIEAWKLGPDGRPVFHVFTYVDAAGRRYTARS